MVRGSLVALALVGLSTLPVRAEAPPRSRWVVVLPARIAQGQTRNGELVQEGLEANLKAHGFKIQSPEVVQRALLFCGVQIDSKRQVYVPELSKLRAALGVDYVLFFSMRTGVEPFMRKEFQSVVNLNIGGSSGTDYAYTNQKSVEFSPDRTLTVDEIPEDQVIMNSADAGRLATKILDGFYEKYKL